MLQPIRPPLKPYQLKHYLVPVDEGMMQQLQDNATPRIVFDFPKFLYWQMVRPEEKN